MAEGCILKMTKSSGLLNGRIKINTRPQIKLSMKPLLINDHYRQLSKHLSAIDILINVDLSAIVVRITCYCFIICMLY